MEYKDYVLCKLEESDKPYLFYAPRWSHIKDGSDVIVETKDGEKPAKVMCSITLGDNEENAIEFITKATGATIIKKVLRVMSFKELDYSEYEEAENE
jgi:hypothetical protein